jgi:pimeloyl-ACP methyl ester carboxylesterase
MFFFQIPGCPRRSSASATRALVGDAIRRSAVRQDSLTTRTSGVCATPRAARRAAQRDQLLPRVFRSPEAQGSARLAPPLRPRRSPAQGVREPLEDWPKITAPTAPHLGRDRRRARQGADARHGAARRGPFEIKYIPLCGHWVQQEQAQVVNGYLLDFLSDLKGERPATPAPASAPF